MTSHDRRYNTLDAAQAYDLRVKSKRRLSGWLEASMVRRAIKHIDGGKLLDCPCGTGRIDALLRERSQDVFGVDNAEPMLQVYLEGDSRRAGQVADVFDLPFEDGSFSWVVSHRLFHHFHESERRTDMLTSLARVAREGVVFYAWLNTPVVRRDQASRKGRRSISMTDLHAIVANSPLQVERVHWAAWPFSPKAMVVCSKSG